MSPQYSSWLADGCCLLTGSSQGREKESELSGVSSYRDTNPIGTLILLEQGPKLMTSLKINYLHKDLISKYSHIEDWGSSLP